MKKLILALALGALTSAVPAQAQRISGEVTIRIGDNDRRYDRRYDRPRFVPARPYYRGCRAGDRVIHHRGRYYCVSRYEYNRFRR